ncbi:MAG: ABC transporter ATP-binding protein [Planctomycetota bacterium]|nr:ABC transporter ATP-binding protein [Planctomycetota bacterium]
MSDPALRVRDLKKHYPDPGGGRMLALDVPSLDVGRGEALCMRGESGSGKTTLLNVIAGILPADEGTVEIAGERMTGLSETRRDALRARHIGYLFQTFNLLPGLTALENVQLGMSFRPRHGASPRKAASDALDRVGLADRKRHRPAQLSVGQQQRVAIARALAGHPTLVLADEPTSNLDRNLADQCMELLTSFAAESEAALLVVTHDETLLERFERVETLAAPVGSPA